MMLLSRRIAGDLAAAARCYAAGASIRSVLLYPLRRRSRTARHQIDTRGGATLVSPPDEPLLPMFHRIWGRRVYVPAGYAVQPGDTIIDVGANVGVFSVWAASQSRAARIIALEPSPRACLHLRDNIARNGLSNVTIYQAACGGRSGRATLYGEGYETNNSLYAQDVWGGKYIPRYETDVMTLEEVFARADIKRCDLLKMNCEGGEYDVLFACAASTLERVRRIAMEYHVGRQERGPDEIAALLTKAGFSVRRLPLHDGEGGYLYATRPAEDK